MTNGTEPSLENWDDFLGKFLKHEHVKSWPAVFVVTAVKGSYNGDEKAHVIYSGEYLMKKKDWEPNKTNIDIIRGAGITSPRQLIGKKIYFKEVMNFNPNLKKKVPSLEIEKIE